MNNLARCPTPNTLRYAHTTNIRCYTTELNNIRPQHPKKRPKRNVFQSAIQIQPIYGRQLNHHLFTPNQSHCRERVGLGTTCVQDNGLVPSFKIIYLRVYSPRQQLTPLTLNTPQKSEAAYAPPQLKIPRLGLVKWSFRREWKGMEGRGGKGKGREGRVGATALRAPPPWKKHTKLKRGGGEGGSACFLPRKKHV